ncbi:MAG: hypothetical protein ACLGH0_14590, partial [Thermoanaerobaculia bacterium]
MNALVLRYVDALRKGDEAAVAAITQEFVSDGTPADVLPVLGLMAVFQATDELPPEQAFAALTVPEFAPLHTEVALDAVLLVLQKKAGTIDKLPRWQLLYALAGTIGSVRVQATVAASIGTLLIESDPTAAIPWLRDAVAKFEAGPLRKAAAQNLAVAWHQRADAERRKGNRPAATRSELEALDVAVEIGVWDYARKIRGVLTAYGAVRTLVPMAIEPAQPAALPSEVEQALQTLHVDPGASYAEFGLELLPAPDDADEALLWS